MKKISSKLTDLAGNENFKPGRVFLALFAAVLILTIFTGCKGKKDGVTEVIIGTGSAYNPYCYLDEKNELTGFEKAVLDEIDKRLPEYTFTYRIFDFANILLSLETGAIDIAAHQYEFNIERNEKYLYGSEGYTTYDLFLVVRENDNNIKTFNDLKGKKFIATDTTSNTYYVVNKWNTENGNIFEIIFATQWPQVVEDLENGRGDAFVSVARRIPILQKEYNAKIKIVGDPVSDSQAYYLYNKRTGEELKKAVDRVLAELKADGTLSALSIQWLGADYTPH